MKIYIGTTSQIKLQALNQVIKDYSEHLNFLNGAQIVPQSAPSQVPDTPYDAQTLQGARNRAVYLQKHNPKNQNAIYIGLESGLKHMDQNIFEECACCILTNASKEFLGFSSAIMLPEHITTHMQRGKSHIQSLDQYLQTQKLNTSSKDTWGVYTHGALPRATSIYEALRNALLTLELSFVSPL